VPLGSKDSPYYVRHSGFRDATIDDAALLYDWRCSSESVPWWNGKPVSFFEHKAWLEQRISDSLVKVLVWEDAGEPAGMVRIDSNGEVAFYGGSPGMLEALHPYAAEYGGRLKVTLDEDDIGGAAVLRNAGFVEYPARFLAYKS
jgi:hypothetical protein